MGSKPVNISASRGAAVLGVSKWRTQTEIWLEMKEEREPGFCKYNNFELPEPVDNAAILWGSAFEIPVIERLEKKAKQRIKDREQLCLYNDFITCHLDGIYSVSGEIHEGKTTNRHTFKKEWGEPGTDKVPIDIQAQAQHQMICAVRKKCIISVLVFPKRVVEFEDMIPGHFSEDFFISYSNFCIRTWVQTLDEMGDLRTFTVEENPEAQKKMIEKYSHFWHTYIIGNERPEPETITDIEKTFRTPVGTIVATEVQESYKTEILQINEEMKILDERKQYLRALNLKYILRESEKNNFVIDDDTMDKIILLDRKGDKLHTYGKKKNGGMIFR